MILESTIKPKRVTKNLISQQTRNVLKCLSLFLLLIYIFISFISLKKMDSSNEGCYSMRFSEHWKSDLDFDLYVQRLNNESFIERRWLRDIVDKQLLEANGVLLTANMGYGKSSIISNIVCADRSSVWYDFRKQILAYHFCRYDMDMTVTAGTFIRNLASAIVKLYPEMGNAILADDVASDFLYGTRCYKDPISCFEMSILNPLRDHWINQNFIILIDALDECDTAGRNTLFYFLLTQVQRFPSNFKFILTSRNIENINRNFRFLEKDQLIEVSQIEDNSKIRQLETLLGNELGHFLKFEDGKMSFFHKSIIDFLTDESRNKLHFFVHKENGHKLFAKYLLGKLKMNLTSKNNLIEIIHHVAMCKNAKYESMLSGYVRDLLSKDKKLHLQLLYQVVWKYNDYNTTELLLKYIGVAAINTVNTMNQSPAFIAASQGNEETLKCLLNNGANTSFSVVYNYSSIEDSYYGVCLPCNGTFYWIPLLSNRQQQTIKIDKIRSGLTFDQDFYMKTFFYDDWRLITCETALNTAIRNDHLEIVQILLQESSSTIKCNIYDGKTPLMTAVRYNLYAKQQFQHVVEKNPPLLQFITEYEGPNIANFFFTKDNSLKCDGSFSPLHEIIMNDRNTQSMYQNDEFLNKYLKDYSGKMLDKCFDKDGYNLLHRAVMGGNLLGTRFLLKKRMTISHVDTEKPTGVYCPSTRRSQERPISSGKSQTF
ncbi:uncharacterized protein LOC127739125 [Mytilus californianus]|uniref:uncharacterized protein LOC127739125 n=1 Tax=Mytilus californianus TaxID=6549 RepID=UPI0022482BFA|nr:uncharacterized protein LOC127739125 [Mytilus californianus]